jgi:SRSO17 transposase
MSEPVAYPDAVTAADLKEWLLAFEEVCARFEVHWSRPEPRMHFRQYLRGLMAPLERKNSWTIAEFTGELRTSSVERFISLSPWDADALRDGVRRYATENFADERAVLICDPTGFAKKGSKSAGVQRQYSGTLGRIDNCQIGTFLAYANTRGDRVLIDRELYLPEKSWCKDPDRCAAAGVPQEVVFQTRPQQVQAMLARALEAGVPFAWFAADEEFGQNPGLRTYLEENGIAYVMAVPKSTDTATFSVNKYTTRTVQELAAGLTSSDWTRRACGVGSKGFRVYDWASVDSDAPGHQWLIRRSIDDGELAYFHCYNPRGEGMSELVRAIGSRWPIEECFEAAKQEAGLDQYQFRLYHAWYRHITLSMLALAFLAALRRTSQKGTPRLWTERADLWRKSDEGPTTVSNHSRA